MSLPLPVPAKGHLDLAPGSRQRVHWKKLGLAVVGSLSLVLLAQRAGFFRAPYPDLYEASIDQLQYGLEQGHFTSVDLVRAYLARIDEVNHRGAALHAVSEINPTALSQAALLDGERERGHVRGPLHGIPILLKDNIATRVEDGMNTTAGSYALLRSVVPRDATVTRKLREAGAVFLGKTTLSEWSHARGDLPPGWSGVGGQPYNAYYPKLHACLSSAGSGIAASIGLAAAAIGTETDGSITCPSSYNNLAGIKPTVGLTSRKGVIPITENQDTVGPMARSLRDSAIVLSVLAGKDDADNHTLAQPDTIPDYLKALDKGALRGARLGVPRNVGVNVPFEISPAVLEMFNSTLDRLRELGATIIDPADIPSADAVLKFEGNHTLVDMFFNLNTYLGELLDVPTGVRSARDIFDFNNAHPDLELPKHHEMQPVLQKLHDLDFEKDPAYWKSLETIHRLARTEGVDFALKQHGLDAIILPFVPGATTISARAGYPIVSVPMGFLPEDVEPKLMNPEWDVLEVAPGTPVGLLFLGTAWSEEQLLKLAYSYEQATEMRLQRKAYDIAIPQTQLVDVVGCKWWWICTQARRSRRLTAWLRHNLWLTAVF